MQTQSFVKIRLLAIKFEKYTNKFIDRPITAFQSLDCDWSLDKFIEVNFFNRQ